MVLSVPLRQVAQVVADGIVCWHILGVYKLHDFRLRTAFFAHLFLLGPANDTVKGFLRQRAPIVWRFLLGIFAILTGLLSGQLYLSVQHISAEQIVFFEKLLDSERDFERRTQRLPIDKSCLTHEKKV